MFFDSNMGADDDIHSPSARPVRVCAASLADTRRDNSRTTTGKSLNRRKSLHVLAR